MAHLPEARSTAAIVVLLLHLCHGWAYASAERMLPVKSWVRYHDGGCKNEIVETSNEVCSTPRGAPNREIVDIL